MEAIFRMNDRRGETIAHIWSDEPYLGHVLIDLTKRQPFFQSVMELESSRGLKVSASLAGECELVDEFIRTLETDISLGTCGQLLRSKCTSQNDGTHIYLAHIFAGHSHSSIKFDKLLRIMTDSAEIYNLESNMPDLVKRYLGERTESRTITVKQILRKNIEKLQ